VSVQDGRRTAEQRHQHRVRLSRQKVSFKALLTRYFGMTSFKPHQQQSRGVARCCCILQSVWHGLLSVCNTVLLRLCDLIPFFNCFRSRNVPFLKSGHDLTLANSCRRAAIGHPSYCGFRAVHNPESGCPYPDVCVQIIIKRIATVRYNGTCLQALGCEHPRRCRSKPGSSRGLKGVALLLPLRALFSGWVSFKFQLSDIRGFVFSVPLKSCAFQESRYRASVCWDNLITIPGPEKTGTIWKLNRTATASPNKGRRACCSIHSASIELVLSANCHRVDTRCHPLFCHMYC
jgi:hypothetical protein